MSCAQAAVGFYSQRSPLLRGHVVHVQFSNHDQLIPDDAALQVRLSCGRPFVSLSVVHQRSYKGSRVLTTSAREGSVFSLFLCYQDYAKTTEPIFHRRTD